MSFLDTPHKKKSAMLTSIIMLLLLIVFSWIGLSYFDPPISYGMEVNFGTTSQGKGKTPTKNQPKKVTNLYLLTSFLLRTQICNSEYGRLRNVVHAGFAPQKSTC